MGGPSPADYPGAHMEIFAAQGSVFSVSGASIEATDRLGVLQMNARVEIETGAAPLLAEIVGFGEAPVCTVRHFSSIRPSQDWLGRVVDGLGKPIDGKGPVSEGEGDRALRACPPSALLCAGLGPSVDVVACFN